MSDEEMQNLIAHCSLLIASFSPVFALGGRKFECGWVEADNLKFAASFVIDHDLAEFWVVEFDGCAGFRVLLLP
jgi:hypothetical protein